MKCTQLLISFFLLIQSFSGNTQADPWKITAGNIDPANYYGVTVANGMIGIVSAPEPFKIKDVVLAGDNDLYGHGRVSNFLRSFNLLNATMDIDGKRMDGKSTSHLKQELDMQYADTTLKARQITKDYFKSKQPDHIFCMSDEILIGVMQATYDLKLKIPQDVSVLAISNGFIPGLFNPAISYVETSGYKLGKLAMKRMSDHLNGQTHSQVIIQPSILVEGSSL